MSQSIFELVQARLGLEGIVEILAEGRDYDARILMADGRKVLYREAKLTPKKLGHFVALWKRAEEAGTAPFDQADGIEKVIVAVRETDHAGCFVFPQAALLKQGIFSVNHKGGKRGFRLYAPWVLPSSAQAIRTQKTQAPYFESLMMKQPED